MQQPNNPPAIILGNFGNSKRTIPARPAIRVRNGPTTGHLASQPACSVDVPPSVCKAVCMVEVVGDDTVVVTRMLTKGLTRDGVMV